MPQNAVNKPDAILTRLFCYYIMIFALTAANHAQTCPEVSTETRCSTHKNCTTVMCALNITEQSLKVTVDINKCVGEIAVTTDVEVPDESSSFWHTFFTNGVETVLVPGFPYLRWDGFLDVGVYLQVTLTEVCGLFWVKVRSLVFTLHPVRMF